MMNVHLRQSLGFKKKCGLIVAGHRGGNTPFNRYADSLSRLCGVPWLAARCAVAVFLLVADGN